jgi:DNA-binding NarL/FixJ family response regulator
MPGGAHAFPLDFAAISFLIVDDQPFTRRIVRSILHGIGSRDVHESANGAEALEVTRTMMPNIVLRSDQASAPMAFVQNRRRHAGVQKRKTGDLAVV